MTAPASAPPLAVIPHTGGEITVKATLHIATPYYYPGRALIQGTKTSVQFRRGRFRNPSLKDIEKWLNTLQQASKNAPKNAPYYTDKDGDNISMGTEEDWDECVYAWRDSGNDVIRIAMRVERSPIWTT